jgi:glycosyltransferase involved in cell wall biosynthesis
MMSGMRLLMMINFFPPAGGGGVYRPLSFVKYLSRAGWEITVVTPKPGEFWISDPSLEKQVPSGVRVVRTSSMSAQRLLQKLRGRKRGGGPGESAGAGSRPSGRFEKMRRLGEYFLLPDTYTGWRPFAVKEASRLCRRERFDALYSTSPPDSTQLAALEVASRFGIPWLADFRDPWISLYLRDPVSPMHRRIHEKMERRVTSAADTVTVTTKWQEETLRARIPSCNVVRIPNGFEEEDFAAGEGAASPPASGPMLITHCGMLTLGRRSRTFLEGLSRFFEEVPEARGDVEVEFIGARESENERLDGLGSLEGSVRFTDNMPHAECVEREMRSHVLLLVKHDDDRYNGLIPGKLFEYIGARRPVLALAPPGEAADIVGGLRRGEVAGPGDAEGVASALARLYRAHRAGELETVYDLSPRPEFSRRAAAGMMERELRALAGADVTGEKDAGLEDTGPEDAKREDTGPGEA